jgi:hypothetical protein
MTVILRNAPQFVDISLTPKPFIFFLIKAEQFNFQKLSGKSRGNALESARLFR